MQDEDGLDIQHCLNGESDYYRRIVDRHQQRVSAMMWRFSRDAVVHEELVQEVFVQAYFSLSGWKASAPFSHWISRIATRTGYRYWKRQARERAHPTVSLQEWDLPAKDAKGAQGARGAQGALGAESAMNAVNAMESVEAAEYVHSLLAQLPPKDRLVMTLRFLEDRSVEEVAQLTGMSATMVKVQTWRARKKLKKLLKQSRLE